MDPDPTLLAALVTSFPGYISEMPEFERGVADEAAMMRLYGCYPADERVLTGLNFGSEYRAFVDEHGWAFRYGAFVRMAATFFRTGFAPRCRAYKVGPIVHDTETAGRVAIVHGQGGRLWVCCEIESDAVALALALSS